MSVFLDSALIDEIREAVGSGFIAGVTTNPMLMARASRPAYQVITEICSLTNGPVFYQVTARDRQQRELEARRFAAISPGQIVIKIPCTYSDLALVSSIASEIPCAVTTVFSASQALLAVEAGACYVAPYVNRATRLMGDGIALVRDMAAVMSATGRHADILAASLKTPEEVVAAVIAGARHVTLPLALIKAMAHNEHTVAAIHEFDNCQPR